MYDKDRLFDDKLGEVSLNPDGKEIFRSEIFDRAEFEREDKVTGRTEKLTQAFGPFVVNI